MSETFFPEMVITIKESKNERIPPVSPSLTYPTDVGPKKFWLVDSWTEILALGKFSLSK